MARGIAARYTSLRLNLIFVSLGPPPAEALPLYSPASARAIVGRRGSTLDLHIRKERNYVIVKHVQRYPVRPSDVVKRNNETNEGMGTHEKKNSLLKIYNAIDP